MITRDDINKSFATKIHGETYKINDVTDQYVFYGRENRYLGSSHEIFNNFIFGNWVDNKNTYDCFYSKNSLSAKEKAAIELLKNFNFSYFVGESMLCLIESTKADKDHKSWCYKNVIELLSKELEKEIA